MPGHVRRRMGGKDHPIFFNEFSIGTKPCYVPRPPCCRDIYRVAAGDTRGCCCCCAGTSDTEGGGAGGVPGDATVANVGSPFCSTDDEAGRGVGETLALHHTMELTPGTKPRSPAALTAAGLGNWQRALSQRRELGHPGPSTERREPIAPGYIGRVARDA